MDKVKIPIWFFMLSSFYFLLLPFTFSSFAEDQIVAVVNNEVITKKDVNDFSNFMRLQLSKEYREDQIERKIQSMKSDLLDKLIEDRLILQEAKKNNVQIDESKIKSKMEEVRKHYASEEEFKNSLEKQGMVLADLETKIREQLLMYNSINVFVKKKVAVNPGDITDFYYKNIKDFKMSEQREFESIVLDNPDTAQEVSTKLAAGDNLIDLSLKYAFKVNNLTAKAGGELRKDIEDAVFLLKVGDISPVIKIDDKYYIFKLDKITPAREESLEEAKDSIYRYLYDQKLQEELVSWLDELKRHAYIKISS
jgi:peptidyl-prolyl cis-trans isomerase SurA